MENLAGIKDCDKYIKRELIRAGIKVVQGKQTKCEVPYSVTGRLQVNELDIKFNRGWCYWMIDGNVPLELAKRLYSHPQGKATVRVTGNCGCPPPESPWIDWISNDGKILGELSEWGKYPNDSSIWNIVNKDTMESKDGKTRWVKDPTTEGIPYITSYHIDDQAGLLLFAEMIKGNIK